MVTLNFIGCSKNCEEDPEEIKKFFDSHYFRHLTSSEKIDFTVFGRQPTLQ